MRHNYRTEQWLPCPLPLVFAFFANPENLPRLMPAWQNARIEQASIIAPPPQLSSDTSTAANIAAGAGTRLTISFRPVPLSPVRLSWEAEITSFAWNDRFCDRQLRGPFAYWNHCHTVSPETRDSTPGTLLSDHVEYELPFGSLGDLAHRLFVARQLRSTFAFRQQRTSELLPQFCKSA